MQTISNRPTRLALAAAFALAPAVSGAQARDSSARPRGGECYRFAFGAWTPSLDLEAAGHRPLAEIGTLPSAPGGRDWAMSGDTSGVSTMLVFPAWWPAGVSIRLPSGAPTLGDTARGTATALVADVRSRSPVAAVHVMSVVCGSPPVTRAAATPAVPQGRPPTPPARRPPRPRAARPG